MRILHSVALVLAVLSVSCTRGEVSPVAGQKATVRFSISTKGSQPDFEKAIGSIDILVFREDGTLDAQRRTDGEDVCIEVSKGIQLQYHIVANSPEELTFTKKNNFLQASSVFEDGCDRFVMSAGFNGTVYGDGILEAELKRLTSKIEIAGIEPYFINETITQQTCTLKSIFLINVNGTCPYTAEPQAGDIWYNKLVPQRQEGHFYRELDIPLVSDAGFECRQSFYCYPNPVGNDVHYPEHPEWSERNTRLVLEVMVGQTAYYYPIDMPPMKCNTLYSINNIKLLGLGSSHPDEKVSREKVEYSVTVNEWIRDEENLELNSNNQY